MAFFLDFCPFFGYHNAMVSEKKHRSGVRNLINTFYYETWLPFVFNKRRILVLAIASYIALC